MQEEVRAVPLTLLNQGRNFWRSAGSPGWLLAQSTFFFFLFLDLPQRAFSPDKQVKGPCPQPQQPSQAAWPFSLALSRVPPSSLASPLPVSFQNRNNCETHRPVPESQSLSRWFSSSLVSPVLCIPVVSNGIDFIFFLAMHKIRKY